MSINLESIEKSMWYFNYKKHLIEAMKMFFHWRNGPKISFATGPNSRFRLLMRILKNCFILLLNKTAILSFLGGTLTKIAYYSTVSQRVINYETEESGAGNQVS